jgi:probable phosphoglycerate mutase
MEDRIELWLVRHGETTYNEVRRLAGQSDPPLTDAGRGEAEALRPLLDGHDFASVWSSDLVRTITTARLAWGEPKPDVRLREVDFGSMEGITYEEIDLQFAEVFMEFRDFRIPNGETYHELRDRVHGFVDGLPVGRHLLFVHGGVIRVLTQEAGLDRFVATGSVVGIDWTDRQLLFLHERGGS